MRKIQVLLAFLAIISTVLIVGLAFAEDGKAQGQPFQALQQQIDALKQQVQDIQANYYTKTEVDALLAACCGAEIHFSQVSAGWGYTGGVKSDGTVACWGDKTYGQSAPTAGTFIQVACGGGHTCGLQSNGTVLCWGRNDFGQSTPPAGTFTQVSAGAWHTCGLQSDGTVVCWGRDDSGESTPPQP